MLDLVYAAGARRDLADLTIWIAERADEEVALTYVDRIERLCRRICRLPTIGSRLTGNVRSLPFERTATIFFRIEENAVVVLRILRAGRRMPPTLRG